MCYCGQHKTPNFEKKERWRGREREREREREGEEKVGRVSTERQYNLRGKKNIFCSGFKSSQIITTQFSSRGNSERG
jgi:hypothetical protein